MDAKELQEILKKHKMWLNEEGGERANLQGANLRGAYLQGADLDFSVWPLWCGSIGVSLDTIQLRQLVYHAMVNMGKTEQKKFLSDPIEYANGFHRIPEVDKLDWDAMASEVK